MVPSLPPWFENRKKRQARAPKVYVRDTGLPHALPGISGEDMMPGHRTVGGAPFEGLAVELLLGVLETRDAYDCATHTAGEPGGTASSTGSPMPPQQPG